MISRYSVKKPYTVVVAIVLVLLLGLVSVTRMSTDLLPSMNLPYAVVLTTYQGASPETVELAVTRPIEQSMATVTDISNVSSQSSENMSMVVLEFQENTDMDSATIEIREKLDQISGYFADGVGKPLIMKLNPDMMPIMIAAVEIEGLDAVEVTDYVDSHISAELESVAGVASVSTTGSITESVEVFLRQEKIDAVNEKVMDAIDRQFEEQEEDLEEAQKELDDGKKELEDGKKELEDGKAELEDGKQQMASGIAQGSQQLYSARDTLEEQEDLIGDQLDLLDEKQEELDSGRQELEEGKTQAQEALAQLGQTQTGLETLTQALSGISEQESQLSGSLTAAREGLAALEAQISQLEQAPQMEGYEANMQALTEQKTQLEGQIAQMEEGLAELTAQKETLTEQQNQILEALEKETPEEAQEYLSEQTTQLWNTLEELATTETTLNEGQAQLDSGKAQLEAAQEQIKQGKSQISSGQAQLSSQQILSSLELSRAQAQLDSGSAGIESTEAQLEEAQEQLDAGRDQLEEARKQARDQSSLSGIVTVNLVEGILAGENFSMPAGYIQEGQDEFLVRVGDKFSDMEDMEDLVILDLGLDGLDPIRLGDVADVTRKDDSGDVYARLGENPGIMLTMEKQTDYSTGDVADSILERMDQIEEEQPGVHFYVLMNQGVYIDLVVDSVVQNMLSGAILAVLILLIFMKDIKPTIVVAFSIPISVVAAFVLMYFSHISLNVISLAGLALGVGMLVDNSIVVIENIDRLRQQGVPVRKAAVEGANQVAGAIAASTLTTVCVFAPIVFTEGITRQLFVDMGLTIAYSLLASLVVALTLVPMMSAGLLKNSKPKTFRLLEHIKNGYGKILSAALHVKPLVILLAIAVLLGSAVASLRKGTAFMPEMESTQATMTVSVERGTPFEELTGYSDQVIAAIEDIEDIQAIGAMAGGGTSSLLGGSGTPTTVSMYLLLNEERVLTGEELEKEIEKRTADIPCEISVSTQSMDLSALGGRGIQVRIKGRDLDELAEVAGDVADIARETEGTENVSDGLEDSDREFRIVVDKEKAMKYQLTVAQVFQAVSERLSSATSATELSGEEKDFGVYVRSDADEELTRKELKKMRLEYTDKEGKTKKVKLSKIATFENATGPRTIQRDAQSRYLTVTADIADGYNIGLVAADLQEKLDEYELPGGYTLEMVGEDESINDAMEQLMFMLALALVFMYLIMVAQFQSLLSPFIIMFTVPLAFTGGFLGLVIADLEFSVIAMVGFVMLSGVIVNNGIVLVDYTNQLRMEGMPKRQALIQAGKDRLRPIIMTALTTILGLSTMAAGMGMGGDMIQPMAVVTIGGLTYGTLLTLFVVPCIYDLLNRKEYRKDERRLEDEDDGSE